MSKGKNFSCNNVDGKRRASDFYETPYSMTRQFLDVEHFDKSKTFLEPACGDNAIVKVLRERFSNVHAHDLKYGQDFLGYDGKVDYIITNPPFSLAKEFILKAKEVSDKFSMLLPLSYLHGKERHDLIYMSDGFRLKTVYVFTRYPMLGDPLREDGKYRTGMMVYAWFVWEREYNGFPTLKWIDNHKYVIGARNV